MILYRAGLGPVSVVAVFLPMVFGLELNLVRVIQRS